MITADYCQTMARYQRWQNRSLVAAADGLNEADRTLDRGAFFGSIHRTMCHLIWADMIWMSRFDGGKKPKGGIPESPDILPDWEMLKASREEVNARIVKWASGLTDGALEGDLSWFSGALGRDVTKPLALCVTHFFNHGTHHRGQIHAMLTAAGAKPDDTDLFVMPEDA